MCDFHSDPPHWLLVMWPLSSCNDWREENRTWNRYTVMTTTKRCYIPSHMPLLLTVAKSRLPAPLPHIRSGSRVAVSVSFPPPPTPSLCPPPTVQFWPIASPASPAPLQVRRHPFIPNLLRGQCHACYWCRGGHNIHIVRTMLCLSLT